MRALAIDFGLKRVGLAVCDPEGLLASPYGLIERTTRAKLFDDLLDILQKEGVERVVVGLPLDLEGRDTETTRQARNFAASLARRTDVPVELYDERLTSAQAEDQLREAGIRCPKRRKTRLDSQAATVLLESWLRTRTA
ncbi:MAG: Holliday junction resolvase RuvX [Desulfovibrionaceae bacterium]